MCMGNFPHLKILTRNSNKKKKLFVRLGFWSSLWHIWQVEPICSHGGLGRWLPKWLCAPLSCSPVVEADSNALILDDDWGWGAWGEGANIKKMLEHCGRRRWQLEGGRRKKNYFQASFFGNKLNYGTSHSDLIAGGTWKTLGQPFRKCGP